MEVQRHSNSSHHQPHRSSHHPHRQLQGRILRTINICTALPIRSNSNNSSSCWWMPEINMLNLSGSKKNITRWCWESFKRNSNLWQPRLRRTVPQTIRSGSWCRRQSTSLSLSRRKVPRPNIRWYMWQPLTTASFITRSRNQNRQINFYLTLPPIIQWSSKITVRIHIR